VYVNVFYGVSQSTSWNRLHKDPITVHKKRICELTADRNVPDPHTSGVKPINKYYVAVTTYT